MIARDFLDFLKCYTSHESKSVVMLRTIGPDSVTDFDKANKIYSIYYANLREYSDLFDKLLYNEITFAEFDDELEALDFVRENFPSSRDQGDPDYFIQYFLVTDGELAYSNDSIKYISRDITKPSTFS